MIAFRIKNTYNALIVINKSLTMKDLIIISIRTTLQLLSVLMTSIYKGKILKIALKIADIKIICIQLLLIQIKTMNHRRKDLSNISISLTNNRGK
jgi:hypothetical protein